MKKGGYQIIDLSAYKFTNGESQIIKNVYNIIKNTKKVVLISGLTVDNTEYHDMFVVFVDYETFFCGLAQYEGNNICFSISNDGYLLVNVSKKPIAYLYNGIRITSLPKWDTETYPYAGIIGVSNEVNLIVSSAPFVVVDTESNSVIIKTKSDGYYCAWYGRSDNFTQTVKDVSSISFAYEIPNTGIPGFIKEWTNHDIYYEGTETIYLPASEPVPVYE